MLRNLTASLCVLVAVAGCSPNEATETTQIVAAQQSADVSIVLDLLQDLVDRFAPLTGATTPEQLESIATELGCDIDAGVGLIECLSVPVGEDLVFIHAAFTSGNARTFDGDAHGSLFHAQYALTFEIDADRGLVGSGDMVVSFPDRVVAIETEDLVLRLVADQDGMGLAAVFVSGHVTVSVEEALRPETTGSAALAGASALVALDVDGVSSLTPVNLRP